MRAAAGAISRARARAHAHLDTAIDFLELGELQGGQYRVVRDLNTRGHAPDPQQGRLDVMRSAAGAFSRARAGADEGARAP